MQSSYHRFQSIWRVARATLPFVAGVVVLVVIIAWLSGVFEQKIEPGRTTSELAQTLDDERTDIVHEVTKQYIEEAIGSLKAASRTVVSTKALATIREITVTAGDQVQQGDVLIRLDSSELEARKRQAEQALVSTKAVRQEATTNFDRTKRLLEQRAVSRAEYDKAEAALRVAEAEVQRAQQAVREADVLLSYATIGAPKDGRVVDRLAEPGDTARPGEPILVLYDAASLRLEAPVLEHLAVNLRTGDKLRVYVDAIDEEIEATIDEIVPQADAPSRSFLVKASLPRSERLYEGMFGRLRIPAGTRRHLCLSTAAIQRVGQLEFVHVVLPDNTLERRFIKTGRLGMPDRIEVLSGLRAGERVVLHGQPGERAAGGQPSDSGTGEAT